MLIDNAPAIMMVDPVRISSRPPMANPANSPNTSAPHANPQSWLVFESGIPRPMPMYLAAYCWNRSPITQQKPPTNGQNSMVRARWSCVIT